MFLTGLSQRAFRYSAQAPGCHGYYLGISHTHIIPTQEIPHFVVGLPVLFQSHFTGDQNLRHSLQKDGIYNLKYSFRPSLSSIFKNLPVILSLPRGFPLCNVHTIDGHPGRQEQNSLKQRRFDLPMILSESRKKCSVTQRSSKIGMLI